MKRKKILIFSVFIGAALIVGKLSGGTELIRSGKAALILEKTVGENLALAAGLYLLFTVFGSLFLALPGVTFAVLAGFLFGPVLGTVLCVSAATAGACAAFLAGRFFLRESIRPLAVQNRYLKKWLFDENGRNQMFILMITRLIPVFPYNLQNFAYGVTDMSFVSYAIGSFLFMLPGTAMYTVGAAGLADGQNRALCLMIAAGLAAFAAAAGIYLKKRYMDGENREKTAEQDRRYGR